MASFTLDAGALIAADRGDRRFWKFQEEIDDEVDVFRVPAVVLTQVWRGPRNANLMRALRGCELETLDLELALAAGVLCGRAGTNDAVDAIVVASAARTGDHIVTTDPDDLRALAAVADGVGQILDLNGL
ncbi:MAG: PIN domain-containing protein [Acidimicrobiia bacterium]|jgi:hypothetical protein|nr:PIN domain-containing protein [Acidimicrobiia bacterium]